MIDPDPLGARRFEALVLPHMTSAFNVARWLTHDDQDAQDVVQEAYLRAFRFFDGFRGENARAWLLSIVRNTFYTWPPREPRAGARYHRVRGRRAWRPNARSGS